MLNILLVAVIVLFMSTSFLMTYKYSGVHTTFTSLGKSFAEASIKQRDGEGMDKYYFDERRMNAYLETYFTKHLIKYGVNRGDFEYYITVQHYIPKPKPKPKPTPTPTPDPKPKPPPGVHPINPDDMFMMMMKVNLKKHNFTDGKRSEHPQYFKLSFSCRVFLDTTYTNSVIYEMTKGINEYGN